MKNRLNVVLVLVLFLLPALLFADDKPKKKANKDKNAAQSLLPAKLQQLQEQLDAVEKKIAALEPNKDADADDNTENELAKLKQQRDEVWKILDETTCQTLEAAIESDPDKAVMEFLSLCPEGVEKSAFLKCVAEGQKFLQKQEKLQKKQAVQADKGDGELEKLEEQRQALQDELDDQLPAFQEKLFLGILEKFDGYRDKDADLPVDDLDSLVKEIQKYDFGWNEDVILLIADDVWKKCRPALGRDSRKKLTRQMIERHIARQAMNHKPGEKITKTISGVDFVFHWCPPGSFLMGGTGQEQGYNDKYEKQHKVTLSHGFWMLETEVTQAMWYAVMKMNPSDFKGGDLPVESVTLEDCSAFCKQLSDESGLKISLPTDAQWEYACRAGSQTPVAGTGVLEDMAWYKGNSNEEPQSVGTLEPNAWGLYDMQGNVWEWTADYTRQYSDQAEVDPKSPLQGKFHFIRGGCFKNSQQGIRVSAHSHEKNPEDPTFVSNDIGFRVIWTPDEVSMLTAGDGDADDSRSSRRGKSTRVLVSDLDGSLWIYRNGEALAMAPESVLPLHRKPLQGKGGYDINFRGMRYLGSMGFSLLFSNDATFSSGYLASVGDDGNKISLRRYQNYDYNNGSKLKEMECRPQFANVSYPVQITIRGNKTSTVIGKMWRLDGDLEAPLGKNIHVAIRSMRGTIASFTNVRVKSGRKVLCDMGKNADFAATNADVLLPIMMVEPLEWKYTVGQPENAWTANNYDDSKWLAGKSIFGNVPGNKLIATQWGSSDIWLRKKFMVDKIPEELVLMITHSSNVDIYLNGVKIHEQHGKSDNSYQSISLPENALQVLQKGENVLAVHSHANGQTRYVDVGLVGTKKRPENRQ